MENQNKLPLPENFTVEQFELLYILQDEKLNKRYQKYLEAKLKLMEKDQKDQYAERFEKDIEQPPKQITSW